jgi:hypothetical protein
MTSPNPSAAYTCDCGFCHPLRSPVIGAPYQPGQLVTVIDSIEDHPALDVSGYIGRAGVVDYLEYSSECGQTFPTDPMIGVRFDRGVVEEFWREELRAGAVS